MGRSDRTPAQIPENRKVRRKREWEDTRRPAWVMWVSVLCLVALAVTVVVLSNSDRMSKPQAINGDSLGPDNRETLPEYLERAQASLDDMGDYGDGARWALVTPGQPADPGALSMMVSDQPDLRVSTLLTGNLQWPLPEPAAGHRREDVFASARELIAVNAGLEVGDPAIDTLGVVVHGTPDELTALAGRGDVLSVEALPPDAVFGRIGLRPVTAEARGNPEAPAAGGPEDAPELAPEDVPE
ncbi:MAG: hypothetical protein ACTH1D_06410 [Mycobacteriaceae bacterium]|uniref:hypothetical protein n=1 Tax=Corynebacterium sp. TaxID=1720 RepID=UPI003F9DCAE7